MHHSRLSDIQAAADIIKGHKVNPNVEFYVAAASSLVQKDAEQSGAWQTILDAGAKPLPAGCGPCIGLGTGLLKDGEVGISPPTETSREEWVQKMHWHIWRHLKLLLHQQFWGKLVVLKN